MIETTEDEKCWKVWSESDLCPWRDKGVIGVYCMLITKEDELVDCSEEVCKRKVMYTYEWEATNAA